MDITKTRQDKSQNKTKSKMQNAKNLNKRRPLITSYCAILFGWTSVHDVTVIIKDRNKKTPKILDPRSRHTNKTNSIAHRYMTTTRPQTISPIHSVFILKTPPLNIIPPFFPLTTRPPVRTRARTRIHPHPILIPPSILLRLHRGHSPRNATSVTVAMAVTMTMVVTVGIRRRDPPIFTPALDTLVAVLV